MNYSILCCFFKKTEEKKKALFLLPRKEIRLKDKSAVVNDENEGKKLF